MATYFHGGQFYHESQFYVEADDGQGKRPIPREEWIKSLPASWKMHAHLNKESDVKKSISYFTNLKKSFQKNCFLLRKYADNRVATSNMRFISNINDEEYDRLLGEMVNEAVNISFLKTSQTLKSDLDALIDDCYKEKKMAITICENIAEIDGKPNEFPLKAWHQLPRESKLFVIKTKQQNPSERLPEGLLILAENVCKVHDENVALKGDVEEFCRKDVKIQLEKDQISEQAQKLKKQLNEAEAHFRSKLATQTQALTNQVALLHKRVKEQEQHYLEQKLSLTKKVEQLQQEKESLLTRLSQVAGTKLTMNNPAITDLSDKNRPMKLSEKFNGVYDDDWTDAVEELSSEGIEEKTVVILLRDIVMTAFRLCKEKHMIWIQMPECKLFARFDGNGQEEAEQPYILDVELKEEEKAELRNCMNDFKRCHHKSFIEDCQKSIIPMALQMIQNAKQTSAESAPDVYKPPEFAESNLESQIKETDFTRPMYKKIPGEIQSENPPSPKKQKTLLFNSLDIIQSTGKETVCDRKSQSARADFARPSQQTDAQPNTKQNTDEHISNELKQPNEANSESDKLPKVRSFAKRIVKLCWWMQAMQPQVHLDCSVPKDGKFNHELYKAYMKSGSQIDYIVWPVMFLYENGPLLSKGVAQPM